MAAPSELSVVIPAHNEGPNLRELLPPLRALLAELCVSSEIFVVVRSEDAATRNAVSGGAGRVLLQAEPGYGGALRSGFRAAVGAFVLTMDADLSHPPTFAADLWKRRHDAEILIASRYVAGAGARMPVHRALLSRVLNRFFALGLGVPVRDLSSGFRLYNRSALVMDEVTARDFDILPEIVVRAYRHGFRVEEVPFFYEPRAHGSSNARIIPFGLAYLRTFWRLRALHRSGPASR